MQATHYQLAFHRAAARPPPTMGRSKDAQGQVLESSKASTLKHADKETRKDKKSAKHERKERKRQRDEEGGRSKGMKKAKQASSAEFVDISDDDEPL